VIAKQEGKRDRLVGQTVAELGSFGSAKKLPRMAHAAIGDLDIASKMNFVREHWLAG